ncbi:MAG: ATP-binding cassette domain-containing protein, partial [Nocardioidaceae bacterium]
MQASVSAANIQAQFSFVIALVEALSISAVVWLGVWLVDRDAITIGTLVLFVLLLQNMFKPSRKIVSEWYKIGKVFASVERIDDLLDREVVVQDAPDAVDAPPLEGRLTFAHVSFAYPAEHEDGSQATPRPGVLEDIDFEAHPGEVVALVGFSGAGKSTIAQLVPRLYDPDDGEVLIDGRPLRSLTLSSLRRQVSVVLQDTVLLSGTVAENIGYGVANATQEDIEQAARLANAHEFIMALPDGYQTELGERGSTLSGGQRQRLAIARAFIRHAPILILDEPTTGLDPESAHAVVGALRTLMRGKTTLLISHDLGLIRNADRALVIARGHIVESGPPARLLESGGLYAELQAGELGAGAASASRPSRVGRSGGSALTRRLGRRLAGLDAALDGAAMADRIDDRLFDRDVSVADVRVGKAWVRGDGSCTLRYHVELSGESSPESALIVGRLHETDDGATTYVNRELAQLPGLRTSTLLKPPWRGVAALVASSGLALHPFPLDPALPTLPRALEPKLWRRVPELATMLPQSAVEIVHYPREGACVLRFHVASSQNGQAESGGRALYGKVYPGDQGRLVHDFLTLLGDMSAPIGPRFPRPVVYVPREQLLITEPLPGLPMIRDVLKATWEDQQPNGVASRRDTLAAAARAAGESLAGLHATRLNRAPVRNASDELAALRSELSIVARDWPETAEAIDAAIQRLTPSDLAPAEMVLSHGDFTPSQVLLVAGRPAVVDLDTLCWADPALDLGRFIAQLQLLGAKHGSGVVQLSVDELCDEFVAGYDAVAGLGGRAAAASTERIAFYRATTLARSALRSCRQLKDHRLEVARSLLEATTSQLSRRLVR